MPAYVEAPEIVRNEIANIGNTSSDGCFDGNPCRVSISIGQQSSDIAADVDRAIEVDYENERAVSVETLIISTQYREDLSREWLHDALVAEVIHPVFQTEKNRGLELATSEVDIFVNPSGIFVVGGPSSGADSTGRNIILDIYGGMARHGDGAFSDKDHSKVDGLAAYASRWVAKNFVGGDPAERCELQVTHAIGSAHPVGPHVETFGTQSNFGQADPICH